MNKQGRMQKKALAKVKVGSGVRKSKNDVVFPAYNPQTKGTVIPHI